MKTQSSSSDDSSLKIAFFLVLTVSLFSFFVFTEGETVQKEGEESFAVLSSLDRSSLNEDYKEISFYDKDTVSVKSTNTYHKSEVLGSKGSDEEETTKEEITEKEVIIKEVLKVELTGYSSTVDQTNSDPFTTASGERVRDGIVASNFLPFGTKLRIPEYFGDKEFVVKDRMNRRFSPPYDHLPHDGFVDIWFHTRQEANNLGRVLSTIEIIEIAK